MEEILKKATISVVICTRNRSDHLKKCVLSILQQSYLPKEIIIVDDASKDDLNVYDFFKNEFLALKYRLSKFINSVDIILVKNKENTGVTASRNTGIKIASGDIVAFLDDDSFAHRSWLKNLVRHYKNEKIVGVGGPVIEIGRRMKTPTKHIKRLAYIKNGRIIDNYRIKRLEDVKFLPRKFVPFFVAGNMSFRNYDLLQVKGLDTNLAGNASRDATELGYRIRNRGKLLFEPQAITWHDTAMKGGNRDVINFNLDRFLFYLHRNTTYFFFKHFNFKKAIVLTYHALRTQIKLLQRNKTGLNRDFLKIVNKDNSIVSVVIGALTGFYRWIKLRGKSLEFLHSKPVALTCFKLVIIGGSVKLIEMENRSHFLKKLFGM